MILGGTLAKEIGDFGSVRSELFMFFPIVIHALDLLISSIGIMIVRAHNDYEVCLNREFTYLFQKKPLVFHFIIILMSILSLYKFYFTFN